MMKILAVILLFCALTSDAKPKLRNFRTGNQDPLEEIEGLSEGIY